MRFAPKLAPTRRGKAEPADHTEAGSLPHCGVYFIGRNTPEGRRLALRQTDGWIGSQAALMIYNR
jgi:hypothetical protein